MKAGFPPLKCCALNMPLQSGLDGHFWISTLFLRKTIGRILVWRLISSRPALASNRLAVVRWHCWSFHSSHVVLANKRFWKSNFRLRNRISTLSAREPSHRARTMRSKATLAAINAVIFIFGAATAPSASARAA